MKLRSMLFVPGDSDRKFAKASGIGADALILDLEDSVAPSMKDAARAHVSALLDDTASRDWAFFVRVNPFDTGLTLTDLEAVVKPGLSGILLPKADGAQDVARLGEMLDRLEAERGLMPGGVKIAVVATETPKAMFNLGSYAPAHPRLAALTWGAEDLAAAVGATANKSEDGDWTAPYQLTRTMALFAAAAAEVAPIETLHANFRDAEGLENVSIVRVEQLYPFPGEPLAARMAKMPNLTDVIWCQEEPAN
ncbi:MAG TPA: aldolase/citrate lyase family protein, partial [Chakrabartia sp.]|nr:aldolase/citrate lyase family protein [Chakrabartia sp.]